MAEQFNAHSLWSDVPQAADPSNGTGAHNIPDDSSMEEPWQFVGKECQPLHNTGYPPHPADPSVTSWAQPFPDSTEVEMGDNDEIRMDATDRMLVEDGDGMAVVDFTGWGSEQESTRPPETESTEDTSEELAVAHTVSEGMELAASDAGSVKTPTRSYSPDDVFNVGCMSDIARAQY